MYFQIYKLGNFKKKIFIIYYIIKSIHSLYLFRIIKHATFPIYIWILINIFNTTTKQTHNNKNHLK